MRANQRVSAPWRGQRAGSAACGTPERDLPLPKIPRRAILASNPRQSGEIGLMQIVPGIIRRRSKRMEWQSSAWQRLFIWRMRRIREPIFDLLHNIDTFDTGKWAPNIDNERYGYAPTPWSALPKIFKHVQLDFRRFTFIDIGAGKGRVVLAASMLPFLGVIGVEFVPELCRIAEKNLETCRFLRRVVNNVKIVACDATKYPTPDTPCVFYFYSPFGLRVTQSVVNNIINSYQQSPRDIYLIYVSPMSITSMSGISGLKIQHSLVIPWGLSTQRHVTVFLVTGD